MFIGARGSCKSRSTYIAGIKRLYEEGKITYEEYLSMTGAALNLLLSIPEDIVFQWMCRESEKHTFSGRFWT